MAHVCVGVHGCLHLSARMHVRVCVSVFMHLCLCVSKGVYAVHCYAHFLLLHVCTYSVYSCVYMQSVECMRVIIIMTGMFVFRCVCLCVSRSLYIYSAVLLSPLPIVHCIINLFYCKLIYLLHIQLNSSS